MIEKHGHGGDRMTANERFGAPAKGWLDYSANINPLGPPKSLYSLLRQEWKQLQHYPDPRCRELVAAIASKYGLPEVSILPGNGAAECIDLVVRAFQPRRAALIEPTFSEYQEALHKSGVEMIFIPTRPEDHFLPNIEELKSVAQQVDLIFLGHPNNPVGNLLPVEALQQLMKVAEASDTLVVMDEAFLDFLPNERQLSWMNRASKSQQLIVLRSMTKFYAIPGLRLGFAVAHPESIEKLRRLQVPWSVNHLAQRAGILALSQDAYEEETRILIQVEREWLSEQLEHRGLKPFPSVVNFLLVHRGNYSWESSKLQARMATQGVLIRCCDTFRGLEKEYFRMAIRGRKENERFLEALDSALERIITGEAHHA
jgi:threonine-phosphate decarboxylase